MFDLGWTELLLIGIVALIVVGPKDLPILFRKVGQFVGKAKGMAREFSRAMDDAADEAGIKETASSLRNIADPKKMGLDKIKEATDGFKAWDPTSETGKLSEERAEAARKIHEATANKAAARLAGEVRAANEAREAGEAAAKTNIAKANTAKPAKKPAAKKTAPKKTAAKKNAAKKPAATKVEAAKTTVKPAPKATKKPAATKPTPRKTAANKTPKPKQDKA